MASLRDASPLEVRNNVYGTAQALIRRIYHCPKPTVAAVSGAAITLGCEFAIACDFRIIDETAYFQEAWVRLGLLPPLGGMFLLPGMGHSPARPGDGAPMIFAIDCGWMTLDLDYFIAGETGKVVAPATSFLIDHPDGLAIFDSGFGARVIDGTSGTLQSIFRAGVEDRIDRGLEDLGILPSAIKWVVNSHMHVDHAGGNMWLPNATVVVQASEWDYARAGVDRAYHRSEVETGHKMLLLNGEHDLFGDGTVVVVPTPGHTPGHQSLRVKTATGEAILTGDCCNLKRSLDEMRLPGHVFSGEQYLASMRLLARWRREGANLFFGHDEAQWKATPKNVALDLGLLAATQGGSL